MTLSIKYKKQNPYPIDEDSKFYSGCMPSNGYVYVVLNEITGLYKVGITNNRINRIRQLTTQSGCPISEVISIELEAGYDENPKEIERYIHTHFKSKRKSGEWFEFGIKDIAQIRNFFYMIEGYDIFDKTRDLFQICQQ